MGLLKMIKVLRLLVLVGIVALPSFKAIAQDKLPITKVGVREIKVGKSVHSFPWYHASADHFAIRSNKVWPRIEPLPGTKSMHIGHYGQMEEIDFSDAGHSQSWTLGVSLFGSERRGLRIEPGPVYIRRWYFEESLNEGPMRFQPKDRHYVFCMDRVAKGTFKTIDGKPGCDLSTELDHVIGVIEIEHTYDWSKLPNWKMASITKGSFVSIRTTRRSTGRPDVSLTKKADGRHEIAVSEGAGFGGDELVNRLVYALRTCRWKELKAPYKYRVWPPVTKTKLVIDDGNEKVFELNYDSGAWLMEFEGKQYQTHHPMGVFAVQAMIREIVVESP